MPPWILAAFVAGAALPAGLAGLYRARLGRVERRREALDRALADALDSRDEARQAEAARRRMLTALSEELRDPVYGIAGMVELLAASPMNEEQFEHLGQIRSSASLIHATLHHLVDVDALEDGTLSVSSEPFDLLRACEEAIQLVAPRVAAKRLGLTLRWSPEVPRDVVGDRDRTRQLLLSLLGNAARFTADGGITLRVAVAEPRASGAVVRFEVRDTGPGIPADELDALFDPFVLVPGSARDAGGGLGLTVVRGVGEALGGSVSVQSVVGEGSTFRLLLPFEGSPAPPSRPSARLSGLRLAVVEPRAEDRAAWEAIVAAEGGMAQCFDSVDALLEGLTEEPALLCVAAEGVDPQGHVLREIKRRWRGVPLALSAPFGWEWTPALRVWDLPVILRPLVPSSLGARLARFASMAMRGSKVTVSRLGPLSPRGAPKVLLVDDSSVTRRTTAAALQQGGFAVTLAVNGFEAVGQVLTGEFTVALMDMNMPGLTGWEAVERIRELEPVGHRTPIIAITGTAVPDDAPRFRERGLDGLLTKPLAPETLRAEVARWVEAARRAGDAD